MLIQTPKLVGAPELKRMGGVSDTEGCTYIVTAAKIAA